MNTVNIQRTPESTRIFDKYYNSEVTVSTQEYDYVYSFFKQVMGTKDIAENFTATVFQIAYQTDVSATQFVENLKGQDAMQLSMSMAYYLNAARSNSTLLSVGQIITPDYYASRNIAD
jgi:hypothetical protein